MENKKIDAFANKFRRYDGLQETLQEPDVRKQISELLQQGYNLLMVKNGPFTRDLKVIPISPELNRYGDCIVLKAPARNSPLQKTPTIRKIINLYDQLCDDSTESGGD